MSVGLCGCVVGMINGGGESNNLSLYQIEERILMNVSHIINKLECKKNISLYGFTIMQNNAIAMMFPQCKINIYDSINDRSHKPSKNNIYYDELPSMVDHGSILRTDREISDLAIMCTQFKTASVSTR
jgi:hypothetical protein